MDVVLDVAAIVPQCVGPQSIHYVLQSLIKPFTQDHPAPLRQVGVMAVVDALVELYGQLFLCRSVDVVENGPAVFLVAHYDAPLPEAIIPLARHATAGRPALCH